MTPMTEEFVKKAEGDYDFVCLSRRSRKPSRFDAICFHSQQCVEKYLKARLQEAHVRFPKTHDLVELLQLLKPHEPLWMGIELPLKDLTRSAVRVRYPGYWADRAEAEQSFKTCKKMRTLARASLGLKTRS